MFMSSKMLLRMMNMRMTPLMAMLAMMMMVMMMNDDDDDDHGGDDDMLVSPQIPNDVAVRYITCAAMAMFLKWTLLHWLSCCIHCMLLQSLKPHIKSQSFRFLDVCTN